MAHSKKFWRKVFSGVSILSILLNSVLPYGLVTSAYAQEATPSATQQVADPTPTITPEPTPEASPSATPTATPTPEQGQILDGIATESASLSEAKIPLRMARDFLKNSNKQIQKNYVEGEVIVKFKTNKLNVKSAFGKAQAFVFEKRFSLEKTDEIKSANTQVFKSNKSTDELVKELKSDPTIEYVEPNYLRFPATIDTNDTYKDSLWGLENTGQTVGGTYSVHTGTIDKDIDAPEAWNVSDGNGNIIVAIIDSGVAYNHPDLAVNMWDGLSCKDETGASLDGCNHGYDFESNDKTPLPDSSSHGTHIAGIIAAAKNNSKGVIGVSPQAKIMALKYDSTVATEIKAIDFAIQNGAKVINASFTGSVYSQSEHDAINRFKTAGGIFVAAAGNNANNNESTPNYPSDYNLDNIISVAATDQNDSLASFSNYGATSVDVGAPGTNIYSTIADIQTIEVLNETFESVTPLGIPSGWVETADWGTYDLGGAWGKVLYGDVYNVPYAQTANSTITSNTFSLSGATKAEINFWAACDTEYKTDGWYDYMALEYSSDGINFYPADDPFYSGEEFKWDESTFDILNGDPLDDIGSSVFHYENVSIPNQYLTSNFKFQFRWVANGNTDTGEGDGCLVDDIQIIKYSLGSTEKYDYMDGTSMAAPHVAGLAALIEGYNPSLTVAQVKDKILTTGDTLPILVGNTVSGKRINASQALLASAPLSSEKAITAFTVPGQTGSTVINEGTHAIGITVPFGTNVTALVPTITTTGVSVNPASGVANNFTTPRTYTVTAADSSMQAYTVTVTISADPIATAFDSISATLAGSPNNVANNLNDVTSANISNFTGLYFEKSISGTPVGKLTFTGSLNLSSTETQTFLQNLGTTLDQGEGRIALNATESAVFAEAGATLVMYDMPAVIEENLIVRDDSGNILDPADIVSGFSYDEGTGTVSFDAAHFTQFDIDTTKPVIATSADIGPIEATGVSGATVTYTAPLATDNIDATVTANCLPASGSTFALGPTTVTCNKTDTAGNAATPTTFTVNVQDSTKPTNVTVSDSGTLTNNPHLVFTWPASSDSGSGVNYYNFYLNTAASHSTPVPLINGVNIGNVTTYTLSDVQAALLSEGTTYYAKVRAVDNVGLSQSSGGNWSNGITLDTIAPTVNITSPVTGDTVNGTKVITFTDNENTAPQCSINNSTFVTCTSGVTTLHDITGFDALIDGNFTLYLKDTDSTTNTGTDSQINIVKDSTAPALSSVSVSSNNTSTTLAKVGNTVTLHFFSSEPIKPPTVYIAGHHLSETDITNNVPINGNEWFAHYQMVDGDSEGQIVFSINYVDAVDNAGSTVTGTTDNSTVTFDKTKPVIASHEPITVTATSEDGVVVTYTSPSATDNVDATADAACTPVSGSTFPIGETTVNCAKTDTAGNTATPTSFTVTVTVNTPPSFDAIADRAVDEDSLSQNIAITNVSPGPSEEAGQTVTMSATSSNQTVMPNPSISGDGSTRTLTYTPAANKYGSATITVTANDGQTLNSTYSRTFTITVNSVNDTPIANPDTASTYEDETLTIAKSELLSNDSDVESIGLTLTAVSDPINGTVSIVGSDVVFVPAANYNGSAGFGYTVSDGTLTSTTTVEITVDSVNDAPVVSNSSVAISEDTSVVINLSGSDIEEDYLSYTIVSGVSHGTLDDISISGEQLIYTPAANYNGSDSFIFTVNDGTIDSTPATVSITVTAVGDPTVLDPIGNKSINELATLTFTTTATDPDSAITYSLTNAPTGATINSNTGAFSFTPTETQGPETYTLTINATDGTSTDSEEIIITVNEVNIAPVASDVSVSTNEDTTKNITLSATDTDLPLQGISYSLVTNPAHGTLDAIADGKINYTPAANYYGTDSFTYKANDGSLDSNTATVTITVVSVNDLPVASDGAVSTSEDVAKVITLSATDSDVPAQTLSYFVVTDPSHGTLSEVSGNQITYTPNAHYLGTDSFTFKANDGTVDSNTATITITVQDVTSPTVTKLGDNSIDVTLSTGSTNLVFSETLSTDSKTAVQNALTAGADKALSYSWTGGVVAITATETTTFANDVVVNVSDLAGNTTNSLLLVDSSLTTTQTTPNSDGDATADIDSPEVVITDPDQEVTVTVDGTTDATIDLSSLVDGGTGDIPQITINSDTADIAIPATTVTGPIGWDGVIAAPTVTTVTLPVITGETSTLGTAIEIGFSEDKLSFDNAVRILLPGQAGKRAGYSRPGTDFTEITSICAADSQAAGDALGVDAECKIDVGIDMVIWTKHFTKFASYTQTTNSTSSSNSSSSSNDGNASAPVCNDIKPGSAPTLTSVNAGTNSVTLYWTKAANPVSYYLVTYGTSAGAQTWGNPNVGGSDTTSYTVNGLSGGARYYFRIRAGNGCAPGDYSNELSATPGGGFIETPAEEFSEEVLGETYTPTTSKEEQEGQVLGVQPNFDWKKWLGWGVLFILPTVFIIVFLKKRNQ